MSTMYTEVDTLHSLLTPTSDNRVIGLHGYAQSGKDTVAKILSDYGYTRVAFADPIKEQMLALNPLVAVSSTGSAYRLREVVEAEGWEGAKETEEVRRLLQVYGTEVGRDGIDPNIWIDLADRAMSGGGKFVITDVRFRNEIDYVRRRQGTLVKITRPGYGPVNEHVSDSGLPADLFDLFIDNKGSLDDLRATVEREIVG